MIKRRALWKRKKRYKFFFFSQKEFAVSMRCEQQNVFAQLDQ